VVPYPLHDFSLVNGPSPLPPPPSHFDFAISHFDFAIYHFDFAIYYSDFAVYCLDFALFYLVLATECAARGTGSPRLGA